MRMVDLEKQTILGTITQTKRRQVDGGQTARHRQNNSLPQTKRVRCGIVTGSALRVPVWHRQSGLDHTESLLLQPLAILALCLP